MNTFSEQFKQARIEADITQQKAGEVVGKSIRTIRNWEAGRNTPEIVIQEDALKKIRAYKK